MKISDFISDEAKFFINGSADAYLNNEPFPHLIINKFFNDEISKYIYENFPSMEEMPVIFREPMSYKGQLSDIDGKWPKFSQVFAFLQSEEFRSKLNGWHGRGYCPTHGSRAFYMSYAAT